MKAQDMYGNEEWLRIAKLVMDHSQVVLELRKLREESARWNAFDGRHSVLKRIEMAAGIEVG